MAAKKKQTRATASKSKKTATTVSVKKVAAKPDPAPKSEKITKATGTAAKTSATTRKAPVKPTAAKPKEKNLPSKTAPAARQSVQVDTKLPTEKSKSETKKPAASKSLAAPIADKAIKEQAPVADATSKNTKKKTASEASTTVQAAAVAKETVVKGTATKVTGTTSSKSKVKQDASTKNSKTETKPIVSKSTARLVAPSDLSPNLFSGPIHGIPPYQPKPGEEYMSDAQVEHFRQILTNWKRELMEEVDRTIHHLRDEATNFPDPNDRATQESEFGLELRARDRERKLLKKIDAALARLDDGSYGYCEETGEDIGLRRLEARPIATLCLEAQERHELVERHYGEREDRFRP